MTNINPTGDELAAGRSESTSTNEVVDSGAFDAASVSRRFDDAERRSKRHRFADGLAEIVIGLTLLAVAVSFWLDTVLAASSPGGLPRRLLLGLAMPIVVLGMLVLSGRLLRSAKERIVYPRAGYVHFDERRRHPWVAGLLGVALGAGMVVLVRRAPGFEAWLPAVEGFIIGGAVLVHSHRAGLPRLRVPGLLVLLSGIATSLVAPPPGIAGTMLFSATGVVLAASGALALRRFLRDNHPAEGE
jgi:hypothetical protein